MKGDRATEQDLAEVWRALSRPFADLRTRWADVSRELTISPAAVTALLSVDPTDPRPMRDLAAVLDCDASYITGLVDDLERAGLARRAASATDRRVKVVELTPAGEHARTLAQEALLAPPPELLRLPAAQQRTLVELLRMAIAGGPADPSR